MISGVNAHQKTVLFKQTFQALLMYPMIQQCMTVLWKAGKFILGLTTILQGPFSTVPSDFITLTHLEKGQSPGKHPACCRHLTAHYNRTTSQGAQGPGSYLVLRAGR